jgi:NodT family efflux transporter outer membrane factor (OMF) lipoprotein
LDQTIKNRNRHVELVRRRYREGVVTALDLYQAQGNLAAAKAQKATFTNQLEVTENAIAVLLGGFPGKNVSGTLSRLPKTVVDVPEGLPADLLLQRPDLRAAQHRLMAADASVGQALADHFPSLTLSASVGYNFDPMGWIWNILGNLTAPLFQGRRISANVAMKRALLRQELASYKATLLKALKEVEDALVSGKELREQVRWQEAAVAAAEGALRMSLEQYAQGLISFLPVLTAEQSVYNARTSLITARRELISARIQLARSLGGSWMKKEQQKIQPTKATQGSNT